MSIIALVLVAAFVTLAGREAVRAARLSAALGRGAGLLAACWVACLAAATIAAWAGVQATDLAGAKAGPFLAAAACLLAALELAVRRPAPMPAEPTRSLGAITLVLVGGQAGSATALALFALAAASESAFLPATVGTLTSGIVLTAAWDAGAQWEARVPRGPLRWSVAAVLVGLAILPLAA